MKTPKLRLFVWDPIFCGYECGLAVALAYNVEQAKDLIVKERPLPKYLVEQYREELDKEDPDVYDGPFGVSVQGGDG